MSKERYAEHTVAWELPNGDSVTKSNYNLAGIETKYIPIQTEIISDNKDNTIAELQQRIAELEQENESYQKLINDICNKHRVGSLKELDEIIQATNESLYASREYLEELKSAKWELEEQLKKFTEPKKVKYNKFSGYRGTRFRCPNCNKQIENCIDYTADYYCKHCGQSVIYPKFRVVDNVGELYFEETQAKLRELQGE